MKKFKKIFVAAIVALALVAMPLCSMAAETDDYTTEGEVYNERTDGENQTDEGYTGETDEGYTSETDKGYTGETDETDDEYPQDSATEKNSFEEVYSLLMSHISEILSLAAFVGSLVIAVLYKSGLMPLVEKGLSAISKTAQKIKEVTELGEGKRQEDYAALKGSVTSLEEKLTNMKNAISEYSDRLEAKESAEKREHRMEALTEGVLDLLYEIFMTSALPEYEKARVGEKVAKMKEVISTYEGE
jgi:polyhydroxyalkanoate synthesis regulator phasin